MNKIFKLITVCYLIFLPSLVQGQVIKSGDYEIAIAPIDSWIVEQTLNPLSPRIDNSPVHYRFIDRQERFSDDNNVYFQDFAATAFNQEGIKELSKLEFTFNPAFEKLTLHKVEVERKGKWSDRLKTSRINVINQEQELSNDLFNGLATAVIVVNDVRVGDTVRYQYSLSGRNPVYGAEFGGRYPMGWTVPVDKLNLRIVNSTERPLYFNADGVAAHQVVKTGVGEEHLWSLNTLPKYDLEGGAPAGFLWAPMVSVSSTPDWASVVAWARPHYQFSEQDSAALATFTASLISQYSSLEDQVSEAIRFVQQDIRYFGVELGQNSHIPHSPNHVFEQRYGDCKDKATLLMHLLANLGVKSYPALVNTETGDVLNTRIPAAMSFNHVINMVELAGKIYWVDGTNHSQSVGIGQLAQPDYGYALVLAPDTQTLTAMPKGDPQQDNIHVDQVFVTGNYAEPVDLYVTTRYRGKEADYMRYRLAGVALSEVEQHYLNYYARVYSQIEIATPVVMVDNIDKHNELILTEHYQVGDFWTLDNDRYEFHLHGSYLQEVVTLPSVINRKQPLSVSGPVMIEHAIRVVLPEDIDYQVDAKPNTLDSDTLSYESVEAYALGQFYRNHRLILKSREVPVAETRAYIDTLREIDDDLYYSGVVNGDFSQPVNPGVSLINEIIQQGGE